MTSLKCANLYCCLHFYHWYLILIISPTTKSDIGMIETFPSLFHRWSWPYLWTKCTLTWPRCCPRWHRTQSSWRPGAWRGACWVKPQPSLGKDKPFSTQRASICMKSLTTVMYVSAILCNLKHTQYWGFLSQSTPHLVFSLLHWVIDEIAKQRSVFF